MKDNRKSKWEEIMYLKKKQSNKDKEEKRCLVVHVRLYVSMRSRPKLLTHFLSGLWENAAGGLLARDERYLENSKGTKFRVLITSSCITMPDKLRKKVAIVYVLVSLFRCLTTFTTEAWEIRNRVIFREVKILKVCVRKAFWSTCYHYSRT